MHFLTTKNKEKIMKKCCVAVVGATGRMGQQVIALLQQNNDFELTGLLVRQENYVLPFDIQRLQPDVVVSRRQEEAFKKAEVIIDFSAPEGTLANIAYAAEHGIAMVIGTTGFSDSQVEELKGYFNKIPIILSANMSPGANVLINNLQVLAKTLDDSYDVEIIEIHHRFKKDAPSGTAKSMAQAIMLGRGVELTEKVVCEQIDLIRDRQYNAIGIRSIRIGDVVGDHVIMFVGNGERIEITHSVSDRNIFALGAIKAAQWLRFRSAGQYTMQDVFL